VIAREFLYKKTFLYKKPAGRLGGFFAAFLAAG